MRYNNEQLKVFAQSLSPEHYRRILQANTLEWVVNNDGELGVEINGVVFFMYKGEALIYSDHPENKAMTYRPVGKREFGESGPKVDGFSMDNFDGAKPLPLYKAGSTLGDDLKIVYRGLLIQLHHSVEGSFTIRLKLQMELSLLLGTICTLTGEDPQTVQDAAEMVAWEEARKRKPGVSFRDAWQALNAITDHFGKGN